MDQSVLKERLDRMFDDELMFHGFTNYMRDYELVVYQSVDPRSGLLPRHLRFLFRFCTEVAIRSRLKPDVWTRSTDEGLLETHHVTMESHGYTWGVQCQELYPGATIVDHSETARKWEDQVGIPFHEVRIEGNAHVINLVFSDLLVEEVQAGYSPYEVEEDGVAEIYARGSKIPLDPPDS